MELVLAKTITENVKTDLPRSRTQWISTTGVSVIHECAVRKSGFLGDNSSSHLWRGWSNIPMEPQLEIWYIKTRAFGTLYACNRYLNNPKRSKTIDKAIYPTSSHRNSSRGTLKADWVPVKSDSTPEPRTWRCSKEFDGRRYLHGEKCLRGS